MNSPSQIVQTISNLGFTPLEAEIYIFLLQHSPATGYRIAKGIGRSFTNTYKALSSLQAKGAILVDDSKTRLSRAVPMAELLDQLETRFRDQKKQALLAVEHLPASKEDQRIYHLQTPDQVYERSRRMLVEAEERVLVELFPAPFTALRETLEAAAAQGVKIAARVYAGENLAGVRMVHSPFGPENLRTWPTQWFAMFCDGRQFLMCHLDRSGNQVHEAVWSANVFLARAFYSHVNSDLHHYAFHAKLKGGAPAEELRAEYARLQKEFPVGGDLGFQDYLSFFSRA
jgi:hypothetical protein